jgi:hypothetical protein
VSTPYTYKTHLLVGRDSVGSSDVVKRWEYVPTWPEIQAAIKLAATRYHAFVLTNVIGDELPGNNVPPTVPDYGYCG